MIRHATGLERSQEWLHADHLTGHDLLPLLQRTTLRVSSWSMFPTIGKGDRIELDQACELHIGDIVVYRQTGALVCHRVKTLGPDGLIITGGDGGDRGTDAIPRRDIVGRVTSILRGHRRLSPTHALPPILFASLYRRLDPWLVSFSNLVRTIAIASIAGLTSKRVIGRLLACVFMSCLRFHITERMPVGSIPAYVRTGRSKWSRGPRRTRTLVHQLESVNRLVIQAHLGPYVVGSLHLWSAEQRIHPSIGGLGLELYFADLLQHQLASRTCSRT